MSDTKRIRYTGPNANVILPDGTRLDRGKTGDVSADLADELLETRPHHYKRPPRKKD